MASRLAAAVSVALLFACSGPQQGDVLERDFRPAYTWTSTTVINKVPVVTVHTEPDRWSLYLRDGEDEGWTVVGEQAFNACQVGESYPSCVSNEDG